MWTTVFFDLDGTLTDSGEGIIKCVQYALETGFGIKVKDPSELRCFIGPPLKEQFMEYAHLTEEEAQKAVWLYRERYAGLGIYENKMYPGIHEMLTRLRQANMQLVLTSSKPTVYCEKVLRFFNLENYFSLVVGSEMDGRRVLKKEVMEEAVRRLQMQDSLDRIVAVGDRKYDIRAAKETGIASIGVSYGYGTREELEKEWPDCITDSTFETANVLTGQLYTDPDYQRIIAKEQGYAPAFEASSPNAGPIMYPANMPAQGRGPAPRRAPEPSNEKIRLWKGVNLPWDGGVFIKILRIILPVIIWFAVQIVGSIVLMIPVEFIIIF